MATVTQVLSAAQRLPSAQSDHAPLTVLDGGAGDPQIPALLFDDAATEYAQFRLDVSNYGSGNVTVNVRYSMVSAVTSAVRWGAQLMAYTIGTDTTDLVLKTFATATETNDTVPATTAGRAGEVALAISNLDSLTAGDFCILQIYREGADAGDTASGDAEFLEAEVTFSDT